MQYQKQELQSCRQTLFKAIPQLSTTNRKLFLYPTTVTSNKTDINTVLVCFTISLSQLIQLINRNNNFLLKKCHHVFVP
jgi:hypothetical protein